MQHLGGAHEIENIVRFTAGRGETVTHTNTHHISYSHKNKDTNTLKQRMKERKGCGLSGEGGGQTWKTTNAGM